MWIMKETKKVNLPPSPSLSFIKKEQNWLLLEWMNSQTMTQRFNGIKEGDHCS